MDNELTKYVAGDSPLLLPHSRDDYNALQCELIATRRANDALIMENHKFRIDLKEAEDKLASSQRRAEMLIEELQNSLEIERSGREKEKESIKKQYAENFEKIRTYTLSLLQDTKLKHQTKMTILKSNMALQAKNEEKARQDLEAVWQQRMDAYRNELTAQFNDLLQSVTQIQEEKRKNEENFTVELQTNRSLIDNLHLETRMWKDKHESLELTLDKLKENNGLLREKLEMKQEVISELQVTVKQGIEERDQLQETVRELKRLVKQKSDGGKTKTEKHLTQNKAESGRDRVDRVGDKQIVKDSAKTDDGNISVHEKVVKNRDREIRHESKDSGKGKSSTVLKDMALVMKTSSEFAAGGLPVMGGSAVRSLSKKNSQALPRVWK